MIGQVEPGLRSRHTMASCLAAATPPQIGFPQLHDEVSVSTSGSASVDAGVKLRRGFLRRVPQILSNQFVGTRIVIKDYFCAQVPELVRRHLYPEVSQDRLINCVRNCRLAPSSAPVRDEDRLRPPADHRGRYLVAVDLETISKRNGKFIVEFDPGFGLVGPEVNEGWPALTLGEMQMNAEFQSA